MAAIDSRRCGTSATNVSPELWFTVWKGKHLPGYTFSFLRLATLLLCRFSLDLRLRSTLQTSDTELYSTTRPLPQLQTNSNSTSAVADFGLESTRSYSSSIQRAVQYIHKELINEFGETSSYSSLTMVDPGSHTTSEDLERPNNITRDSEPIMLPEVDFGEFIWPGKWGNQLFNFPIDV